MNQPNSDIFFPTKPECGYGEVVATDRGWEVEQSSGFREILISYPNMKTLMDAEEAKRNPAPVVEETPPPPPPPAPAPAFSDEELAAQAAAKAAAEAAANQGGTEGGEGASGGEGSTGGNEGGEGASNGTPAPAAPAPAAAGTVLFTSEGLNAMKMDELRVIGDKFEVKDTSKAALIQKILTAQEAKAAAEAA